MNELHVLDMSSIVYVGHLGSKTTFFGVPVGGIHYFLNKLAVAFADRDSVVLCFDSPNFRTDLYDGYKSGRVKNAEVYWQLTKLYEAMQSCGIRCEKHDGFEADDIVEWAVNDNVGEFIRGVTIHSNDKDICHSIRNGVSLHTLSDDANDIIPASFEMGIEKGTKIYYNTISAYKTFTGCKSDHIPPFKTESGITGKQLYEVWAKFASQVGPLANRSVGPNPKLLQIFVDKSGIFSDKDKEEMYKRIRLVYPADKPGGVSITPVSWAEVDKERLERFCTLYGARRAASCLGLKYSMLSESDKKILLDESRMLKTGAYAADHNFQHETSSVKSTVLNLDAFSRSFTG